MNNQQTQLVFATTWLPYSADPMEYDASIHHNSFTSVLGTLTSAGKKGEIIPLLAKTWSHDEAFKVWTFELRENLRYSNGDLITAKDYALSLKRIAYLMKKTQSHSGLMEYLVGFDTFQSIDDVKSIEYKNNIITFFLTKPLNDLPYRLAFGFYSLVHPSMFNQKNGEWIQGKETISSYNYKISKWTNDEFELSLRSDFGLFNEINSVKKVKFVNLNLIKESNQLKHIDLAIGSKQSLMFDENFNYIGSSEGFNIGYAQCYGWDDPNKPLHDKNLRKWLRQQFYKNLISNKLIPEMAFFPISLYGGRFKHNLDNVEYDSGENIHLVSHTLKSGPKIKENEKILSLQEKVELAVRSLESKNITLKLINYDNSKKIELAVDFAINGTAIDADSFLDTARFMFTSKQGANLPDETGRIIKELQIEKPNLDIINEEIWDQAIIWPITHYSSGHWVRKSSSFNYEKINFNIPALDFSFITLE